MAPNDSDVLYQGRYNVAYQGIHGVSGGKVEPRVGEMELLVTEAGIVSGPFKISPAEILDVWREGQRLVILFDRGEYSREVGFLSSSSSPRLDVLKFRRAIFKIKPDLAQSAEDAPQQLADILLVAEDVKAAIRPIVVLAWIHLTFLAVAVVAGVILALSSGD